MTPKTLNILSLNIGMSCSLAGLSGLISSENLDIVLLQEVRLSGIQIENQLPGFKAIANVDLDNLSTPGTAVAWRLGIPVENVLSFKLCRIQIVSLGSYRF